MSSSSEDSSLSSGSGSEVQPATDRALPVDTKLWAKSVSDDGARKLR